MKHPTIEVLQDYFENALVMNREKRVKDHVENCDFCTEILTDFVIIETRIKATPSPVVSQVTKARIYREAGELLKIRKEKRSARTDYAAIAKEWRENIFPEIRVPVLQFCSVSIMLATFIAVEKIQSVEETIYEPLSNEVKVYEREDKV